MNISGNDIFNYIPQRPPILMIDSLYEASESKIVSGFFVTSDNIFVENGMLNESGIIENIAQTAAAGIGYKQVTTKKPVNLGYIASIKTLIIHSLPLVSSKLKTTIEVINEVLDITIVNAYVYILDKKIAECEIRIFIKK